MHNESFVWFDSVVPVNYCSIMSGRVFLGWTSTKQVLMCHAQGHKAVTLVRLEPAVPRSRIKQSAIEPLHSTMGATTYEISTADPFYSLIVFVQEFFENSRPQKKVWNINPACRFNWVLSGSLCSSYHDFNINSKTLCKTATLKKTDNWFSRPIIA